MELLDSEQSESFTWILSIRVSMKIVLLKLRKRVPVTEKNSVGTVLNRHYKTVFLKAKKTYIVLYLQ